MAQLGRIFEGDTTDHGAVIPPDPRTYPPTSSIYGGKHPILMRHRFLCPKCKVMTEIIEGVGHNTHHDVNTVLDGMLTSCGSRVQASIKDNYTIWYNGPENSVFVAGFEPIKRELHNKAYDIHFQVIDKNNGEPIGNISYRIILEDGRKFVGITDRYGFTELVSADTALKSKIEAPYYGDDAKHTSTNTNIQHDTCRC